MERRHWLRTWQGTRWDMRPADHWRTLPACLPGAWLLVTACNPRGRVFSATANRHRDQALFRALRLRRPVRARGRAEDGHWQEPGWLFPLAVNESPTSWLRTWGQLAALQVDRRGWYLVWCDGVSDRWPG